MNEDKASGVFDQITGKIKQGFGEVTGNESVANEGAADQVKGNAKETWGNVKDTAGHLSDNAHATAKTHETQAHTDAHTTGHSFRDEITSGAEHVKDSIKRGLDHLEGKTDH